MLGLLLGEYSKAAHYLLRANDFNDEDAMYALYMQSLAKTKSLIDFLYFEFISTL